MAKNQTVSLSPKQKNEDIHALDALTDISTYNPANDAYTVDKCNDKRTAMQTTQMLETQAEAAFKAARDNAVAAEWDFHNQILGVKLQVSAQFGDSSNELQALGLKKKTEYKTRGGRKPAASSTLPVSQNPQK